MMDDASETPELTTDPEMRQLLGLFDVPAFARRGQELEFTLERLHARCGREREAMLDMVRLRLRQWAAVATGPEDGRDLLGGPLPRVADTLAWAAAPGPAKKRAAAARDLIASVERFNRRWAKFVAELPLGPINAMIDRYNQNYIFEKECVFRSPRIAARNFRPRRRLTPEALLEDHPLLPPLGAGR